MIDSEARPDRSLVEDPAASERLQRMDEMAAATTMTEAFAGMVAVIMAVLGLIKVLPVELAAVGVMVVGAAAVLEGAAIVARAYGIYGRGAAQSSEVTGMTTETLTGIAAVILGALALLRVSQTVLLAVASIVLGVGVIFAGGTARSPTIQETLKSVSTTHLLVGLAVIVMGVVGLVGAGDPVVLTLAAVLVIGGEMLLSGAAVGGRIVDALSR